MILKEELFPIGIGTWKIDYENFNNDIDALVHSYNSGQNYLSLYMLYNNGNVEIDWYCKGGITIDQLANQFE